LGTQYQTAESRSSCVALEAVWKRSEELRALFTTLIMESNIYLKNTQHPAGAWDALQLDGNQRCYDNAVAERINGILSMSWACPEQCLP
jgi:hypothetical protein